MVKAVREEEEEIVSKLAEIQGLMQANIAVTTALEEEHQVDHVVIPETRAQVRKKTAPWGFEAGPLFRQRIDFQS